MSAGYIIYSLDWDKFRRLVERPTQKQLKSLGKLLRDGLEDKDGQFEDGDPIVKWPTDLKSLARIAGERLALPDWYGDLSMPGKSLWEDAMFRACIKCDDIDVGFRVDNDGIYWDVIEIAWKHHGIVPNTITAAALSGFGTRPYRFIQRPKTTMTREEYDRGEGDRKAALSALSEAMHQSKRMPKKGPKAAKIKVPKAANIKDIRKAAVKGIKDMLKIFEDPEAVSRKLGEALEDLSRTSGFRKLEKIVDKLPTSDDDDFQEWLPGHSMHTPDEVQQMQAELRAAAPAMKATKNKEARRQYQAELMPAIENVAKDGRMLCIQVDT